MQLMDTVPEKSVNIVIISSDPSVNIGETGVYTVTAQGKVLLSQDSEKSGVAQGFDGENATIECGVLTPFFLDPLMRWKNTMYVVWVQITPTEIRCMRAASKSTVIDPVISFVPTGSQDAEDMTSILDTPLALKACVVRNVVGVLFESSQLCLWAADHEQLENVFNSKSVHEPLLRNVHGQRVCFSPVLALPFRSFHLTVFDKASPDVKEGSVDQSSRERVEFWNLYVTAVPLRESAVYIFSLQYACLVFKTIIESPQQLVSASYLENAAVRDSDTVTTSTLRSEGSMHLNPLVVGAEMAWLDPGDVGPTLLVLVRDRPVVIYRTKIVYARDASAFGVYLHFPFHFVKHHTPHLHFPYPKLHPDSPGDAVGSDDQDMLNWDAALCRFGNVLTRVSTGSSLRHALMLPQGSLWILRLPQAEPTALCYTTEALYFLAAGRNQLHLHISRHRHGLPVDVAPWYSETHALSWLSLHKDNTLQLASLAFDIPVVDSGCLSLWSNQPLAQMYVNVDYCVRVAFQCETKLLACGDLLRCTDVQRDVSSTEPSEKPRVSCLKLFDFSKRAAEWISTNALGSATLFPFSTYEFDVAERITSIAFVQSAEQRYVLAAGTSLYTAEDAESVLGRVYIFHYPAVCTRSSTPERLVVRVVQLFPGPVLYMGSLCNPRMPPLLVHSAGRILFVKQVTEDGITTGSFYNCSSCILAVASIKSYFVISDAVGGPSFVMLRHNDNARASLPSFALLAKPPVHQCSTRSLCGVAVDYISMEQTLYMLASHSTGFVDVLEYPAKRSTAVQLPAPSATTAPSAYTKPYLTRVHTLPPLNDEGVVMNFHRIECFEPRGTACLAITALGGAHYIKPTVPASSS